MAYLIAQLGKPYDTFGVLGLGFNRNWQDDRKWWCSEYTAMAALQGGYNGFSNVMNTVTPQDVYNVTVAV